MTRDAELAEATERVGSNDEAPASLGLVRAGESLHRNAACVLGIPIDLVSLQEVASQISSAAAERRRLFISTPNLNFLALSHRSSQFRATLWASDLCTADGIAVVAVCRLLGVRVPERVAGSDFLAALASAEGVGKRPVSVSFFGGTEEAGIGACRAINARASPNLRCSGHTNPGFGSVLEMSSAEVMGEVNAKGSDFLVVALGAEKGQAWIMANRSKISAPVVSHLGATINFLAGTVKRAPPKVRALNLEWLWRIYQEPNLSRRYFHDGALLARLTLQRVLPFAAWASWSSFRYGRELTADVASDGALTTLTLRGAATAENVATLRSACEEAITNASRVRVNLKDLHWADANGMGVLLMMWKAAADREIGLEFVNAGRNLTRGLTLNGLSVLLP